MIIQEDDLGLPLISTFTKRKSYPMFEFFKSLFRDNDRSSVRSGGVRAPRRIERTQSGALPADDTLDAGMKVVAALRRVLQPAAEWTVERPRGFEFWPGLIPMRVEADEGRLAQGLMTYRVRVSTEYASFEGSVDQSFRALIAASAAEATLSGWYTEMESGRTRLRLGASVGVHEGTVDVLGRLLSDAAVLQLKLVYDYFDMMLEAVGKKEWVMATLQLTTLNGRYPAHTDEMRWAADQVLVPMGHDPRARRRLSAKALGDVLTRLYGIGVVERGEGTIAFIAAAHDTKMLVEVSTATENPTLGAGYLMLLHTGRNVTSDEAFDVLVQANRDESNALLPIHCLGSWCRSPKGKLTYVSIVPIGAASEPDPAVQVAAAMTFRAMWAVESGLIRS